MKTIQEKWRAMPLKRKVSVMAIAVSILLFVILFASSGSSNSHKTEMSPRQMVKQLKQRGSLVTLKAVVRGFAWEKVPWSGFDPYYYGISRTAYVDYAIDLSELTPDDFKINPTKDGHDGKPELTIAISSPTLCEDTLIPPTEDKPIEFIHGTAFRESSKDEVRNKTIEGANQAIADTVKKADKELKSQAKSFAEEELGAMYEKIGFNVEIKWK